MLTSRFHCSVRVPAGLVAGRGFATLAAAQLPANAIDRFLANSSKALRQSPIGGVKLVLLVHTAEMQHPGHKIAGDGS